MKALSCGSPPRMWKMSTHLGMLVSMRLASSSSRSMSPRRITPRQCALTATLGPEGVTFTLNGASLIGIHGPAPRPVCICAVVSELLLKQVRPKKRRKEADLNVDDMTAGIVDLVGHGVSAVAVVDHPRHLAT
jgi:hypothetical protein